LSTSSTRSARTTGSIDSLAMPENPAPIVP
jgi:hypothetical protein